MNYDKAQFMLSTSTSVQSDLAVSGYHITNPATTYRGTKLVSTWNSISLRELMRNVYDKYTRVYLEVYLVTTAYVSTLTGYNGTWDQYHILKLSGLNFVNNSNNFVYVAPFKTVQGAPTFAPTLENNGMIIDITSDDIVTLSSTLLNCDFNPHCSPNPWPTYNIFFNAYGVPGYERVTKDLNKNNY
jgi:hypothetical protein